MAPNDGVLDPKSAERAWEGNRLGSTLIGVRVQSGGVLPIGPTNPLPMTDARPEPDGVLYALSGDGARLPLPLGAGWVEILPEDAPARCRFGGATLEAVIPPTAAQPSGAPTFISAGGSLLRDVRGKTHYAIHTTGAYTLSWWLA